jgi:hypothetical protein
MRLAMAISPSRAYSTAVRKSLVARECVVGFAVAAQPYPPAEAAQVASETVGGAAVPRETGTI